MEKKKPALNDDVPKHIPENANKNVGSAGFNEGADGDPDYDEGTPLTDEEKKTGHAVFPPKHADPGETD
jgi:hypothetical protein